MFRSSLVNQQHKPSKTWEDNMNTFNLKDHGLTVEEVHHNLPPSRENFKTYEAGASTEVKAAGPA